MREFSRGSLKREGWPCAAVWLVLLAAAMPQHFAFTGGGPGARAGAPALTEEQRAHIQAKREEALRRREESLRRVNSAVANQQRAPAGGSSLLSAYPTVHPRFMPVR